MALFRLLQPPLLDDEEDTRVARAMYNIQLILLAMAVFALPILFILQEFTSALGLVGGVGILIFTFWLNKKGYIQFSSLTLILLVLGVVNYLLWNGQGIHDIVTMSFVLALIIAGLLLDRKLYYLILGLVIFSADLIIYAEISGWKKTDFGSKTNFGDMLLVPAILVAIGLTIRMLSDSLFSSLAKTRQIADQQARLILGTRDQAEQLAILNQVSIAVASGLELEQVLIELYQQLKSVVPLDSFYVALVDSKANLISFPFFISLGERVYVPRETLDAGLGLTGEIIRTQRTLHLPDANDPIAQQEHEILNVGPGDTRSYLGIPLHLHGEMIGVLSVQCIEPYTYSGEQIRLLETIASQASVAIDNAQLFVEVTDALRREERLNEVAHVISGAIDLQFILENVVRLSAELLGADAGTLSLVSPDQLTLTNIFDFNIPDPLNNKPLKKGRGVTWEIIETCRPVCLNEYADHPNALPELVQAGFHGYAGAPILAGEQCLGALGLLSADPLKRFLERDLALLVAVSRLAGAAIQNARLFAALQDELVERRRVEHALQQHDAVLEAMTYAAEKFLKMPEWELNIQPVLERLGQETDVTHAYLIEINPVPEGHPEFSIRFIWNAPDAPREFPLQTHSNMALNQIGLERWYQTLSQGEVYYGVSSPSSPYAFQPKEEPFFKMRSILSLLSVPIFVGENLWGAFCFDDCSVQREWMEAEVDALKVAADVLSAAIQRQHADDALRQSEQRLRAIFENSATGIALGDIDGLILTANPSFEDLFGYSVEELHQLHFSQLSHPDDLPEEMESIRSLIAGEIDHVQLEKRYLCKDGRLMWGRMTASLIYDESDKPIYGLLLVNDITEQKQAIEDLRERDAILESVAFAAVTFMQATDWRDSINVFLEMLGRETRTSHAYIYKTHTDQEGRMFFSMDYEWTAPGEISDLDDPFFLAAPLNKMGGNYWLVAMLHGEPYYGSINSLPSEELEVLEFYNLQATLDVPIIVGGNFWGFIGFDDLNNARDWSEAEVDSLKAAAGILSAAIQRQLNDEAIRQLNAELEQRVRQRTSELENANQEMEAFAYSVSHDLRTPLRGIDGYSRLLLEDFGAALDEQSREYLDNIRKATSQMGQLIEDLLKLSRVTRLEMHYQLLDLTSQADDLLAELRRQQPEREVEVIIWPDLQAFGDPNLLRLALENLISNAWKFTSKTRLARIEIGSILQDNQPVIYVRDNGVGFDMKYSHKLFIAFQRLHSAEEFEGTGVGLATVQRIIQRHSGRIWAESAVNQGATFFFTLPGLESSHH